MIHDFNERLIYSFKSSDEDFWEKVYRKLFPTMTSMTLETDLDMQRQGVDRLVFVESGRFYTIDEKKRSKEYNDILLEYISVDTTGALGWIEKSLRIDFLAYAFMQSKKCYVFPFPLLQKAWREHKEEWMEEYPKITAENVGYNTHSLAIPKKILFSAVCNASIINI